MATYLTDEHVQDLTNRMSWYITNPDNSVLKPKRAPSFIQMVAKEIACRISPEPTEQMLYDLVGKSMYHCKDKLGKASHKVAEEAVYVATVGFTTTGKFPPVEPDEQTWIYYEQKRDKFRQAQLAKRQAKQGQATARPEPTPEPTPAPEPTTEPQVEPGTGEPDPTVQEPAVEPTPEPQCELTASA